ncbi:DUF397 domain-containing protein [Marinitenerispora sediminis]|uniref:DUF397 domain-containing protein n=1 Tax=Marinitenerispora sediminis TaxID=1931232 RepID=A0A368T7M5_9ACTN|nr:DUF397 domain-containing protein [Marinitenerispora sediminis]RCV51158.1 DUF397 domain-containing protein [Marinitenerispora sediminis]RCV57063.1 DUF397 domain-containing protein [Marinitenerispora sediminis]RCV59952.1 DUF397 domain-containing protein [Marinitenerispora sediminis]
MPLKFRKSSYSDYHDDCVEVADLPARVAVRDSHHPERGHLTFPTAEWAAFLSAVHRDEV